MFENLRLNIARTISPKAQGNQPAIIQGWPQLAGNPVYPEMTARRATREGYKLSLYVYRGVRTIIQAASAIPWVAKDKDGKVIPGHDFELLMRRPNTYMSGQDLIEFTIAHLCLPGNALWQPVMVNGKPKEFHIIMPDLVRPIPSANPTVWLEGWEVSDPNGGTSTKPAETFIHFMQVDPGNPYWGIGPLMASARTVDADNEAQDTQKVSMQNRGMPSGILSPEQEMTAEDFAKLKKALKEKSQDKASRREPWAFNKGMKWEQMSMTPVEMDYILTRLHNKRDIAAALGISPIFLGDLEQSSYNNMAEARRALYQDAVIPMLDDLKATLNLYGWYGDAVTLSYDLTNVAALREDYNAKTDQAMKLWGMGVPFAQINNKLNLGFELFPGSENSYLPFSVSPVGQTSQPVKHKSILYTEEQKTVAWKRVDARRVGWWGVVQKRVSTLYRDEGAALSRIKGKTASDAKNSARAIIEAQRPAWEKVMKAAYLALIEDFGKDTADELGLAPKFRKIMVFDPAGEAVQRWVLAQVVATVKTISETNLADVAALISAGFDSGDSIWSIGKSLRQFYEDSSIWKAERVARTEVAKAASFGQIEAARQSGVVAGKTWLTSRDDRVRDAHLPLEGETVPLDARFSNGLEAPGIGDDPGEVINCRCTMLWQTA